MMKEFVLQYKGSSVKQLPLGYCIYGIDYKLGTQQGVLEILRKEHFNNKQRHVSPH